ncbi:MAG: hypothetical protein FVQ79_02105 [Planctomycetes bacterium]|nr:hypothetical protein [Planctomycetota bacterium]
MSNAFSCSISRLRVIFIGFLAFCTIVCGLDKQKYIPLDEIARGMEAYCLTVYEGAKIERFEMEVISVVYDYRPGQNMILVVGKDERFKHSGPVQGCSGSPVYIDGRMAGALSYGYSYAKDPLYMVTPIAEMLNIGTVETTKTATSNGLIFDFSEPIDLAALSDDLWEKPLPRSSSVTSSKSPILLVTSLPSQVCDAFSERFDTAGIRAVAGSGTDIRYGLNDVTEFQPGGVLAIPLVSGDISMSAVGTITEVLGEKVYGFGHAFLGYGSVDLPMATGFVHTVVSNLSFSFKLSGTGPIRGAIRHDENFGVYGTIGDRAELIPLRITVRRYNDPEAERVYNCKLAVNRFYTPIMLQVALIGAGQMLGPLPPDHTVNYKGAIKLDKFGAIDIENISSGRVFAEVAGEAMSTVSLLMNNPFGKVKIDSMDFEINIGPQNRLANVRSVELSDYRVKAGDTVKVAAIVESHMSKKSEHQFKVNLPEKLAPGKYEMMIGGSYDYAAFLRKARPYNYIAKDLDSLVAAIKRILALKRGKIYAVVTLGTGGVVVRETELPDLPPSKTVLMTSGKRTTTSKPYQHRLEQNIPIDSVVLNSKALQLIVEE